ncbi:hypothetical protein RDABS01_023756, partial [Bienertia sinuspersici]
MSVIKLPNLKNLALVLKDPNSALIGRNGSLFRACPLLEYLMLDIWFVEDGYTVNISTPNLMCLHIYFNANGLEECKVVIDAPMLVKCIIGGDLMFYEFVKKPSNLQQGMIFIEEYSFEGYNDYLSKIPGLIQGISCVRSLILGSSGTFLLSSISRLDTNPIFKNLVHLSFSYNDDCWIGELPDCFLLGNLKRVVLRDMWCENVEINLVQYILSNATVLEQLHMFAVEYFEPSAGEDQLRKEYGFCKKIFLLSKGSVNCEVKFSGTAIIASSKDYKDGNLKRVDLRDMWCENVEINLVLYILSNATVLEQLHMFAVEYCEPSAGEDQLRKEYGFCKKIFLLSKGSVNCEVKFSGTAIIASSKDYKDG